MMTPAKIRQIALFCLAGFAFSSHVLASQPQSQLLMAFQSIGGDAGVIRLEMFQDQHFALEMDLLDFNDHVSLKGTWVEDQETGNFHLTFQGQKPIIKALFAEAMIIDNDTFKIPAEELDIWIYHTRCRMVPTQEVLATK